MILMLLRRECCIITLGLGGVLGGASASLSHPSLVDYLRGAVWGAGNPVAGHGVSIVRKATDIEMGSQVTVVEPESFRGVAVALV
jgi:hypothetical protein